MNSAPSQGELALSRVDPKNQEDFQEYLRLYHGLFPEWEREPDETVLQRHQSGDYFSCAASDEKGISGFFTINPVPAHGYSTLTFIGARDDRQGCGLGSALIEASKKIFRDGHDEIAFFLVEAESEKGGFYLRHGFSRLDAHYCVPRFDDDTALMPMELFLFSDKGLLGVMPEALKGALRHLLSYGYGLDEDAPRFARCFDWESDEVRLSRA